MQVDINQTHRDGLTQCTFTSDTGHNDKIESSLRVVWRTEPGSCCNLGICFYLYQSADIELNPGPVSFTLCTLNIHSILHPLHSAALCDLIDTHNPDLFCLTETWIKPTTTSAELSNCTPPNYTLLSIPRNRNHSGNSACIGGGTGFLIREPFMAISHRAAT